MASYEGERENDGMHQQAQHVSEPHFYEENEAAKRHEQARVLQEAAYNAFKQHDAPAPTVRTFPSGANRDLDTAKLDYEAFLSPAVLERFAVYMHKNRKLADGTLRDGDNWQKGIPKGVYMKSLWRHFMDLWKLHRGLKAQADLEETLCAMMFNTMGYLHEVRTRAPEPTPAVCMHGYDSGIGYCGLQLNHPGDHNYDW